MQKDSTSLVFKWLTHKLYASILVSNGQSVDKKSKQDNLDSLIF